MAKLSGDLATQLDMIHAQRGESHSQVSLMLFFSFDLVGSTEFKEDQKYEWLNVWSLFYGACLDVSQKHVSESVEVWKYIGDEVLLYLEVTDPSALNQYCGKIFDSMREIHEAVVYDLKADIKPIMNKLAVKSTAWLSLVHREFKPVIVKTDEENSITVQDTRIKVPPDDIFDFIGPNIDIGFRLAKNAFKWNLVVSANLAYLALKCPGHGPSIRMIDMQQLKGVMRGAFYPILWYRHLWSGSLLADFDYDEKYKEELARKALDSQDDQPGLIKTLDDFKKKVTEFSHFYEMEDLNSLLASRPSGDASAETSKAE